MPSRRSLPELGIKLLWDCMLGGTPRNLPVRAMVENRSSRTAQYSVVLVNIRWAI